MYPDTDSAPIPLIHREIDEMSRQLPLLPAERITQLIRWDVPEDTFTYILKKNLVPLIEKVRNNLGIPARFTATLLAHRLNHIERTLGPSDGFGDDAVYQLLAFLKSRELDPEIAKKMLWVLYRHPERKHETILEAVNFKKTSLKEIISLIPSLRKDYREIRISGKEGTESAWIMGQLRKTALGNVSLSKLSKEIGVN